MTRKTMASDCAVKTGLKTAVWLVKRDISHSAKRVSVLTMALNYSVIVKEQEV